MPDPGPSRLSKVLVFLTRGPRPALPSATSLKLTYNRDAHVTARHFVKRHLPRIRYANPKLSVEVIAVPKGPEGYVQPELVLERGSAPAVTVDLKAQTAGKVMTAVLDAAGGPAWQTLKSKRLAAGRPLVHSFRPPVPEAPKPKNVNALSMQNMLHSKSRPATKQKTHDVPPHTIPEAVPDMSKTGAAQILP